MTTENRRINKSYYQTILDKSKQGHPVSILGDMYIEEMQKQWPDLSSIRYAQGEIYYQNNDYEAAIFKWQQPLEEELIPWAQKNIADAHVELGLLEEAEGLYLQVDSPSLVLKSEVLMQLFSLYVQQGNQRKAVSTIKEAVSLNPDYSRVTEIAQTYFEDIREWDHAVELAVNETIRTKTGYWMEVLSGYVQQGLTVGYRPDYFNDLLVHILAMDRDRFENMTEVLWNSYRQSPYYIEWLRVINQLLLEAHEELPYVWRKLPALYQEAYFDLINGDYLIREISDLIQHHLTNWLDVTAESDALASSAAILAWDKTIPSMLDEQLVGKAGYQFEIATPQQHDSKDGMILFEAIKAWAKKEGLLDDLIEVTNPILSHSEVEAASPSSIREVLKVSIEFLLEQRVKLEKGIEEEIEWNEALLASLQHIHQQLGDMEQETSEQMTESFRTMKNNLSQRVMTELPKQLQKSASIIQDDSDFSKINEELNEEMNRRIVVFMKNFVHHDVKQAVQQWINECKREFQENQAACNEFSQTVNQQYKEEKIDLQGDFKVLEDWQRDLERISRGMLRFEKMNIFMRNTPSQLFLKGAGKLFSSISKNNEMLHSRYKNYIENEDYTPTAKEIIDPFMQQLELFEGSIEWDVNRFFANPVDVVNQETEKVEADIESHTADLQKMHEKPETYRDPLTLFEVRRRQYELTNTISKVESQKST
ncbi:lipopolysaccharide assembly protein LapB [Virgibacillus sp. SK37]|uniref:tetratricopeptide repeat protein n=1 Tax=Virgibacillus sp. SK37 TaxID=403957 RepID=UPI0004D1FD51|nr:hypothetical protein [Virgibacillus sp. SK37]AIF45704.1 hypothetical protein X953_19505 [Virgibacillus sp. SK37]